MTTEEPLRIVADENIPYAEQVFGRIGRVTTLSGRHIRRGSIRDADILLVRSITRVDGALLEGSPVQIVGTATIGLDHIDEYYLKSRGIRLASAAGSNANSVAEYVSAALLHLSGKRSFRLKDTTLGVVGVGHIGGRVVTMAEGLGMKVLQNDPPLARQTEDSKFLPLDALMDADVITLHVPLTFQGQDATHHLFDADRMYKMKRGSILINTSRGPVVSGKGLRAALETDHLGGAVLDVWENEPGIDVELLKLTDLGTHHIAGYSLDGKVNGTTMIYNEICGFLGLKRPWRPEDVMPEAEVPLLKVQVSGENDEVIIASIVRRIYDIKKDDEDLRKIMAIPESSRGSFFDRLRRDYPVRREFFNTELRLLGGGRELQRKFEKLGFRVGNGFQDKTGFNENC
ncbi:MAG: 4-phosphoerythronate dehydrogenase [Gemmatimonadota bacterium]|nr:MAG: 4-phosphoerythronate dehydrogenase [Gemmatimonadota bacterium]